MARNPRPGRKRSGRAARPPTNRHYPRTARLNALLQEIVADFLERIDDDDVGFVTVTGVEVDNDLNRAQVFFSALEADTAATPDGAAAADARLLAALARYRKPIQAAIGRQARLRKTPEVVFVIDPAVRTGARIEEVIRTLHRPRPEGGEAFDDDDDGADGAATHPNRRE